MKKQIIAILLVFAWVAYAAVEFGDIEYLGDVKFKSTAVVGTSAPDASAAFEIQSTTKGSSFCPGMTQTQRDNISSPADGLCVFNTTSTAYNFYNGSSWATFGGSGGSVPTGTLLWFGGSTAPSGFLVGDGSAISRTTYADLYSEIGDAFGEGDGSTTFNLPDCRGRFVRGFDNAAGNDPNSGGRTAMATGGNTGDAIGSIQADATALPNSSFQTGNPSSDHTHNITGATGAGGSGSYPAPGNGVASGLGAASTGYSTTHSHTITAGGDSETRPLNFYMNCIIKI